MFKYLILVLLSVGCVVGLTVEQKKGRAYIQHTHDFCTNLGKDYEKGKSKTRCEIQISSPERQNIHLTFDSEAVYQAQQGDVSVFIQLWCHAGHQVSGKWYTYSWSFRKEGFTRLERCDSIEEKRKHHGHGKKDSQD